jgi:hypothetical protein
MITQSIPGTNKRQSMFSPKAKEAVAAFMAMLTAFATGVAMWILLLASCCISTILAMLFKSIGMIKDGVARRLAQCNPKNCASTLLMSAGCLFLAFRTPTRVYESVTPQQKPTPTDSIKALVMLAVKRPVNLSSSFPQETPGRRRLTLRLVCRAYDFAADHSSSQSNVHNFREIPWEIRPGVPTDSQ